jgi:tetratricopeptide (TPR) repeat protein
VIRRGPATLLTLAGALLLLSSCAYYNTFYLAQRYYERGAGTLPYPVERPDAAASNEYRRSIDYSKKLLAQYPKSKWVDDAYLLWARALLGRDDPLQTVNMLEGFNERFPDSPLRNEARFYLGVGYRNARRYEPALAALDTFIARAPRHDLIPYAYLERARALTSLDRHDEAARSAGVIIEQHPKSGLQFQAYTARAEAQLEGGRYEEAQADFKALGSRSRTDEERLGYLLREADCLEAARAYDRELALLEDALSYEIEPTRPDSGAVRTAQQLQPGLDRFGRILMRIGTVHLLAGRLDEAIASYRRVVEDYPKTPLGAEAQYRVGYAYETLGDDFAAARTEYDRVKDQTGATGFGIQALQRSQNLARLEQFRAAADDSSGQQADAGFVLAEQYLFQLDKPERALDEYRRISRDFPGTAVAAKALTAEGWVLSRKLERQAEADSVFWKVVREYPATEGQLASRDYLEETGQRVPESLIELPEPPAPPPQPEPAPGPAVPAIADTVLGPGGQVSSPYAPRTPPADSLRRAMSPAAAIVDSLRRASQPAPPPPDSLLSRPAGLDTTLAPPATPDTSRAAPAPADTTGAAADTTAKAGTP